MALVALVALRFALILALTLALIFLSDWPVAQQVALMDDGLYGLVCGPRVEVVAQPHSDGRQQTHQAIHLQEAGTRGAMLAGLGGWGLGGCMV